MTYITLQIIKGHFRGPTSNQRNTYYAEAGGDNIQGCPQIPPILRKKQK